MAYLELQNVSGFGPPGLLFDETYGIRVQKFNPGYPEIRTVEDFRPHQNGMVSSTRYFGAREVSIEFMILPQLSSRSRKEIIETLRGFCNPDLEVYLVEDLERGVFGAVPKRIRVYPSQFDIPYEFVNRNYAQIQWRCPEGYWESYNEKIQTLGTSIITGGGTGFQGRAYPKDYAIPTSGGWEYPQGGAPVVTSGGNDVFNAGNVNAYPLVEMAGPFTTCEIQNVVTGKRMVLAGFSPTIGAGDSVWVDFKNRTARINKDPNRSVYDLIDWTVSDWWGLVPGMNNLAFGPTGGTIGVTHATIRYRDAWL